MDPEVLNIIRRMTASERRLFRKLGGEIPRGLPEPACDWHKPDPVKLRRQAERERPNRMAAARMRRCYRRKAA